MQPLTDRSEGALRPLSIALADTLRGRDKRWVSVPSFRKSHTNAA